jgi:hypothetical protein
MTHKGSTREPKRIRRIHASTLEEKLRRHRNKERVWRRAVARLGEIGDRRDFLT